MKPVLALLMALSFSPVWAAKSKFVTEPTSWYSTVRETVAAPSSPMDFNEKRKMGVGTVMSGATGLLGMHIHFYPGPDFAIGLGYGGSRDLKAFNAYFRHLLTNTSPSLYWTLGYARWSNHGDGPLTKTTPSYLHERFLSPREKQTGTFVEHIAYPGIGTQFYNMSGEMQGMSFYAEGLLMTDIEDLKVNPALGLGAFYYF